MPFFTRSQIIILSVAGVLILLSALFYFGILPGLRKNTVLPPVTLNFWGVGDDSSIFNEITADYQKVRPNARINYRQLDESNYETELLNALAAGQHVDIVMFQNSWLPKHFDKIAPLPAEALAKAGLPISFSQFQSLFPTVAIQDFAPEKIIYATPLYIDTLAMFYNRDIFDSRSIALPPRNWSEFQSVVTRLKKPIAIGGSNISVANASDLLQLLLMQAGAPMVNDSFTRADFAQNGESALSFYTQFANPKSTTYVWSDKNKYSLDSFAAGEAAIMFGYQNQIKNLQARNPSAPLKIGAMPQPTANLQAVNWARYFGLAVPRSSANQAEAWKFILFLTTNEMESAKYLARTGHPPALRSLINKKLDDPDLGVFAQQALSARSYPRIDNLIINNLFSDMIRSVITGQLSTYSAIIRGESEITRLIQERRK